MRFITFLVASFIIWPSVFSVTPKDVCLKKITKLLSTFLTSLQLGKALDGMFTDGYNGNADFEDVLANVQDTIYSGLTNTQLMTAMNIMGGLNNDLGSADASTALENLMSAIQTALFPNAQKIFVKIQSMKTAGKPKAKCLQKGYKMMNKIFTKGKVKKILQQVKDSVGTKSWNSVQTRMSGVLKFSQYTLT
uniref:Uncharacterized protein n=1 Tax=Acrobeloides nanus TaxID=290746 RepID=A0A914BYN0_9BILA